MKINTNKNCDIIIFDDTEYPVEDLSYKDSVSIYIAQLNESNKTTILYSELNNHQDSNGKPIHLEPLKNGYMTMCHIILPKEDPTNPVDGDYVKKVDNISNSEIEDVINKDLDYIVQSDIQSSDSSCFLRKIDYISNNKINNVINNDEDAPGNPDEVDFSPYYFSDGTDVYLRHCDYTSTKIEDWQELLEVNPTSFGLRIYIQNFFSVCYLRKCYVSLCLKLFNAKAFSKCFNGTKVDSQLTYKRDLVWAALNTIQYMIDSNQLAEAQRLLERINGCNGLCTSEDTGEQGCGCG